MRSSVPTHLQIFGERCSGTNFVAQLMRRNLPKLSLTDRYGWKHGFAPAIADRAPDCLFVVVVREPLDWVRSLHQKPWHAAQPLRDRSFSEFVREPFWCEWGRDMELAPGDARIGTEMLHERDPATGQRFANVMRLRTSKLRDWLSLGQRVEHLVVVRYEDVLREPKQWLREIATRCGLRRWPWFRAVKNFKGGAERFVQKEYAPIAVEDRDWIVSQLDWQIEGAVGYRRDA